MKNNNGNNIKANRKINQINKVKSFKKKKKKKKENMKVRAPLSSVTIDIVGQHYKERAYI